MSKRAGWSWFATGILLIVGQGALSERALGEVEAASVEVMAARGEASGPALGRGACASGDAVSMDSRPCSSSLPDEGGTNETGPERGLELAQIFSPGDLSRVHEKWNGLTECSKCHTSGKALDRSKCLGCHSPLRARIQVRKGYHGRSMVRGKPCESCHTEHKGRDVELIQWPSGSRSRFPHRQTGWSLEGGHGKVPCEKCHDQRLVKSRPVLVYLATYPNPDTLLGIPTDCAHCHFDEHRGTLEKDCKKCHDENKWKSSPRFDHAKTWPLVGAHVRVKCDKCHKPQLDPNYSADLFPKPRAEAFLKMKGLPHEVCTDCHKDPHRSRFGPRCTSCHTQETWAVSAQKDHLAVHEKTAFPLEGRHQTVPCGRCHPKKRDGRKLLKPIPHDKCARCHPSAHPDIPAEEVARIDCIECHSTNGYLPTRYSIDDHAKTRYPLTDAHLAVPCNVCHLQALGEPFQVARAKKVRGRLSSLVVSPWRLRAPEKDFSTCSSCHVTPHRDQLGEKKCTECHLTISWQVPETFDHSARTRYKLDGRHEKVTCEQCHGEETDADGKFVRYRPIEKDDCMPCHEDQHFGQFTRIQPSFRCSSCHATKDFKTLLFDHNKPDFSDWPLRGKHEKAKCEKCHPVVILEPGAQTGVFRPTPRVCGQCHEDAHKGAYAGANLLLASASPSSAVTGKLERASGAPWGISESWGTLQAPLTDCTLCHKEISWQDMTFDHDKTGFQLEGLHRKAECEGCHEHGVNEPPARECGVCHEDVHEGRLGPRCEECHRAEGFEDIVMPLARHARTVFPLIGKHAIVPCIDCHQDARDMGFGRTPTQCVACHQDPPGPGSEVDHTGFPATCERCHTPLSWGAANFLDHDRCFPISGGSNHGGISCESCHIGPIPAATGTCSQATFSCTSCHGCESGEHNGVPGYECQERKCYQCHPGGSE